MRGDPLVLWHGNDSVLFSFRIIFGLNVCGTIKPPYFNCSL